MSKIGRKPVDISSVEKVVLENNVVVLTHKGNTVSVNNLDGNKIEIKDHKIYVTGSNKANWGTVRSLVDNAVIGLTKGFSVKLTLIGVGFKAKMVGDRKLHLGLGFSRFDTKVQQDGAIKKQKKEFELEYDLSPEVSGKCEGNNVIMLSSINKQLLNQEASQIIKIRPPEPYKGKGVIKEGAFIVRKKK